MTKPTIEEMKKVIYEEIADKTIKFGLKIIDDGIEKKVSAVFTAGGYKEQVDKKRKEEYYVEFAGYSGDVSVNWLESECKIIGHPIYPHHILQWADKKRLIYNLDTFNIIKISGKLGFIGEFKRDLSEDLEGQSDETIKDIYNLIQEQKGDK